MKIDADYLHHSLSLLEEFFLCLACEIWHKLNRKDKNKEQEIISIISKMLLNKHNITALNICEYCKDDMFMDESNKLILDILKFTALKNMDKLKEEDLNKIRSLNNAKKNSIYELAQFILLGNETDATRLFIELYKDKKISLYDYFSWPILHNLRDYSSLMNLLRTSEDDDLRKASLYIYSGLEEYDSDITSLLLIEKYIK